MKRAIICTLLLVRSIVCSSSTNKSDTRPEHGHINKQKHSLANSEEDLSSSSYQCSNSDSTHTRALNAPSIETCKHTAEYGSALSICPINSAMKCEHAEAELMQRQEDPSPSIHTLLYRENTQSTSHPACPAQSTNPTSTPSAGNRTIRVSLEDIIKRLKNRPQKSTYRPILDRSQLISVFSNSACRSSLRSNSALEPDISQQAIDYTQIEQTKKNPEMNLHPVFQNTQLGYTNYLTPPQHMNYPLTEYKLMPNKNAKRKEVDINNPNAEEKRSSTIKKRKYQLSNPRNWNENRLKHMHRRTCRFISYKPVINPNSSTTKFYSPDEKLHQKLLKEHVDRYKSEIGTLSPIIRLLFIISTQASCINTKLVDCEHMVEEPENYTFMEGIHRNYSSVARDILDFMEKYEPIITNSTNITTEWEETLGDIFVRQPMKERYLSDKRETVFEDTYSHCLVSAAVHMVLSLPEVYFDLCNSTPKFVEETLKRIDETARISCLFIKELHSIANMSKSASLSPHQINYTHLIHALLPILSQKGLSLESTVIQLYSRMYEALTHFYERAEICREVIDTAEENEKKNKKRIKKYSLLHGKCMIKPQRYLKCTASINIDVNSAEKPYKVRYEIEEETNRWAIKPHIAEHYHIHYVDNTAQRYKRLCMPLHPEIGYIHTIRFIIEYIQRTYRIVEKECIFPYKRDKTTGAWSYVTEEEMKKTMHDLSGHHVVFYYIEEDLLSNHFTFAQFNSYMEPGRDAIPIPLFLTPLARSLAEMGPFEEEKEHAIIPDMEFKNRLPDIYAYRKNYTGSKYLYIHHYYSNLYIRLTNADTRTIDCYIMDAQDNKDKFTWYIKVPCSVAEYTHCVLDESFKDNPSKYKELVNAIQSQEYTPDSKLHGFKMHTIQDVRSAESALTPGQSRAPQQIVIARLDSNPKTALTVNRKKIKKDKKDKKEEELKNTSPPFYSLLVFRNTNTTKSSLGSLNELFDALAYMYSNF